MTWVARGMTGGVLAACLSGALAAEEGFWEYDSWRVYTYDEDLGEDIFRHCIATTGGDGLPSANVEFFSGDAGPPHNFPSVVIEEYAPRGYDTQMQEGMSGYIIFDNYETAVAIPDVFYDPDGYKKAMVSYNQPYSQWVLQRMRRNARLDLVMNGRPVTAVHLNGFTAAYLKAAEECGFDGTGVVD